MSETRDWEWRSWTALIAFSAVLGCASQPAKGSQAASERQAARTPEEIEALFSREKELPAARPGQAADGAWTAQFPSETEVSVTAGDGHTQAEFSLGTEAKTRCVFYQDAVDAGQTIGIVLEGLRKKGTLERISPYRVASAQGTPIVFLEARYTIAADGGKQAGSLKLAISPRLVAPSLCFLDEPGYVETFATGITEVLKTLETKEAPTETTYSEIWSFSTEGIPFGFQWLQMIDQGDGKWTTVTISASFIPTGPGKLSITDEVEVMKSDGKGVFEGNFYETQDGEVAHDLTLERSGKSKYSIAGKLKGKDYQADLKGTKVPDDIAGYRLLRKNHEKSTKLELEEFDPSLDPSTLTKVKYEIDGKAHAVTIEMGDVTLLGTLTEEGLVSQVVAKVGERELKQEIIHRSGKF